MKRSMSGRSTPGPSSLENWDYTVELECLRGPQDLQLAAELGKTLLERNKELENSLKQHQDVIDDQAQEIEYLTKQTAALREVNDSRLRIYEQLEVSIQELERENQRLHLDNSNDKKHIKSLCTNIETLEARCEELQKQLDESIVQRDAQRRRQLRRDSGAVYKTLRISENGARDITASTNGNNDGKEPVDDEEEIIQLLSQLQEMRNLKTKDQRKISELEEQVSSFAQENAQLEDQINILQQKAEELKILQEEITTLEEVRREQLCARCMRPMNSRAQDEMSSIIFDHEEDDDVSVVNSVTSEPHCSITAEDLQVSGTTQPNNPYRVLVEKYEALLEMQRHPTRQHLQHATSTDNNCLSLQEELQMSGDFNSFMKVESESDHEGSEVASLLRKENVGGKTRKNPNNGDKAISTTPTDFSEAETSSSGFSDETSNKATQTDNTLPPGSFLCSIADGDDCRFSIYDDASPIESRFRKNPEYKQLFREIFDVLKRAAEAKDEGEKLPLLEDSPPLTEVPKVPPVTPGKEELPVDFAAESKETSKGLKEEPEVKKKELVKEEAIEKVATESQTTVPTKKDVVEPEKKPDTVQLRPLAPKGTPLDYLSVSVSAKRKSKRRNSPMKHPNSFVAERVNHLERTTPMVGGAVGASYASRAAERRAQPEYSRYREYQPRSPSTLGVWCRNDLPPNGGQPYSPPTTFESSWAGQQTFVSSASQEVAKLKNLEMSYAEVLRMGPQRKRTGTNHRK